MNKNTKTLKLLEQQNKTIAANFKLIDKSIKEQNEATQQHNKLAAESKHR